MKEQRDKQEADYISWIEGEVTQPAKDEDQRAKECHRKERGGRVRRGRLLKRG